MLITVSYLIHEWQWLEVTRSTNARTIQRLRVGFACSTRQVFAVYCVSHSGEILQEACESRVASFLIGNRSSWMLSSLSWGHIKGRRGLLCKHSSLLSDKHNYLKAEQKTETEKLNINFIVLDSYFILMSTQEDTQSTGVGPSSEWQFKVLQILKIYQYPVCKMRWG